VRGACFAEEGEPRKAPHRVAGLCRAGTKRCTQQPGSCSPRRTGRTPGSSARSSGLSRDSRRCSRCTCAATASDGELRHKRAGLGGLTRELPAPHAPRHVVAQRALAVEVAHRRRAASNRGVSTRHRALSSQRSDRKDVSSVSARAARTLQQQASLAGRGAHQNREKKHHGQSAAIDPMSVVFHPFWYTFWRVSYAASFCCWKADFCIVGSAVLNQSTPLSTRQGPGLAPKANGSRGPTKGGVPRCLQRRALHAARGSRPCTGLI